MGQFNFVRSSRLSMEPNPRFLDSCEVARHLAVLSHFIQYHGYTFSQWVDRSLDVRRRHRVQSFGVWPQCTNTTSRPPRQWKQDKDHTYSAQQRTCGFIDMIRSTLPQPQASGLAYSVGASVTLFVRCLTLLTLIHSHILLRVLHLISEWFHLLSDNTGKNWVEVYFQIEIQVKFILKLKACLGWLLLFTYIEFWWHEKFL